MYWRIYMADLSIRFFSNCLRRTVEFRMFLPNDKRNDIPWEEEKHAKGDMKPSFCFTDIQATVMSG